MPSEGPITQLLQDWRAGDESAREQLVPLVYDELRRMARRELRRERPGHSLQPTELVHDAYYRLVDLELPWQDRAHFFHMAARTMRRVLIDHARARKAAKRGGGAVKVSLAELHDAIEPPAVDLLDLVQALEELESRDERLGSAVELYYFGGMTYREIGEVLGTSSATVDRDLRFARSWLKRAMSEEGRRED